jgi:microsomal epoxide hydrolase
VDLKERLANTRWPERETVGDGSQGPPLARLQALHSYWSYGYDWRRCEALLNRLGQFRTMIDGVDVHFLHIRSREPNALPLVLTHGWPGSILEFRKVFAPLTDPVAYSGNPGQAFHLIVPSLPGFAFGGKPDAPGWNPDRIADAWIELVSRLGYEQWAAQGGDWGSAVTMALGQKAPAGLVGIHLNFVIYQPTPEEASQATPEEQRMLDDVQYYQNVLSGYAKLQGTRPQTLSYALSDSPVGQAAWIYALFQDVSDSGGDPEKVFTLDEMLDDIMLYWLPNASASSARLYWETTRSMMAGPPAFYPMRIPTAISIFPKEQVRISRRWAEARFANLVHFNELPRGGHFAALEQPDLFVEELRQAFAGLR